MSALPSRRRDRSPARSWLTHALAIVLGALLSLGLVAPSQASPSPEVTETAIAPELPDTAIAQAAPRSSTSFVAAAVDRVGPAVVRIDTERTITRRVDPFPFNDPFFERFFGSDDFRGRMPREQQQRLTGLGSGFIYDRAGLVLTNAHVVDRADRVTVTLKDGREFDGTVLGTDTVTDLAVVKIDARGQTLPVAPLGDSANVRVGDWAIAVGNPLGLDNTVTLGIISTLNRSSVQAGIPSKRLDFIQTDAAINPGNSGGPLLDETGRVIGINTAIRADAMGIGFAIPIDKAKEIQASLARGEAVPHPFVGIQMQNLTPELARQNNRDPNSAIALPEVNGILVMNVLPDTPAVESGLRRGDVIVAIDGNPVTQAAQLQTLVENSRVGQTLRFTVRRGDRTLQLSVRTAQMSDAP
jgi:S1-C subfamily serine protease